MTTSNYSTTFLVDQTPTEAFNAINNVRGWWSKEVEGGTENLNDEFTYRYKDFHFSRQRLIEVVPNKKIVWLVTESQLNFISNKSEWTGTKISFEISPKNGKTLVQFTHQGLNPEVECFDACTDGWNHYLHLSLLPLISKGTGKPD